MKFYTLAVFTALQFSSINAHTLNPRHNLYAAKRQATPGGVLDSTSGAPQPPSSSPVPSSSSPIAVPSSTTASSSVQVPTIYSPPVVTSSSTLASSSSSAASVTPTGPPPLATWTGVPPLESITLGMPTRPVPPVTATFAPGASPPIAGAPVLPTGLVPGSWPPTDRIPDTNSKEVQAWMKELDGFKIPNLAPTVDGSCGGDPAAAAAAAQRGWWTCGGYTRTTDIVACPDKNTWGVSFDDGPSVYTPYVLDYLHQKNLTATFFVVGSRVVQHPAILIEEYMSGHEISVHTWSHSKPLTSLTNEEIVAELGWTRRVIKDVLGVTPTTMRPPWGDIDDRVRAISLAMGMVPIMWTATPTGSKFDTNDWMVAGGSVNGTESFKSFQSILNAASTLETGFIVLQHDLSELTVDLAVGYTLEAALSHVPKFTLESIGQCQHFPKGNLYLETNKNETFPFRNHTSGGVDVTGDGTVDTKSGDGGSTAADANKANADSPISAAFSTNAPILTSLMVAVCAVMSILL